MEYISDREKTAKPFDQNKKGSSPFRDSNDNINTNANINSNSNSNSGNNSSNGSNIKPGILGNIATKIGNIITSPLKWRIQKEDQFDNDDLEKVDEEITINTIKVTKQESLKNIYYAAQSTSDQGNLSQEIAPELSNSYSTLNGADGNELLIQHDSSPSLLHIRSSSTVNHGKKDRNSSPYDGNAHIDDGVSTTITTSNALWITKKIEQTSLLDLDLIQSPKSVLRYSQRDLDKTRDDLEQGYAQQIEILQVEINGIHAKYSSSLQTIQELRVILAEYERTMAQILQNRQLNNENNSSGNYDQILQEKRSLALECQALQIQLCNLHQKYEEMKKLNTIQQQRESLNNENTSRLQRELIELEGRFQNLKSTNEQKLLEQGRQLHSIAAIETELAATKAKLTKSELKIVSLETNLENKTRENQELVKICDELIQKMS